MIQVYKKYSCDRCMREVSVEILDKTDIAITSRLDMPEGWGYAGMWGGKQYDLCPHCKAEFHKIFDEKRAEITDWLKRKG